MAHKGFLVIADISGYTAFLTQSELEHAQDILNNLTNTLLEETKSPLIVSKLEGDAVFSYALEHSFLLGQSLLEALENVYCAFTSTRERMKINTTCTCTACSLIPTLDLKIALHFGEFMIQKIGKGEELSGSDVIAVHRLLKNTVKEKTGIEAYLFITEKASQAMQLGPITDSMVRHTDTYEHIGELAGYVHDLQPVWKRLHNEKRVTIPEKEVWFTTSVDLPTSPALVWEYLHESERRAAWMHSLVTLPDNLQQGRVGVGSGLHCDHGNPYASISRILDWHPFDSVAYSNFTPPGVLNIQTISITPTSTGSHITITWANPVGNTLLTKFVALLFLLGTPFLVSELKSELKHIETLIANDIQAGKLVTASSNVSGD
jgi:uncharacterized protein YndB with AHSA1/START domain